MAKKEFSFAMKSYEDIFKTEEERRDTGERVVNLKIDLIEPFKNHPFKVTDDEEMRKMADSIREFGVMVPAIVRRIGDSHYEMISGHRRRYASMLAGKEDMPCIIRDLDDDAATILMVDANLQREHILPSEKAKAYKMKLDAIKHQGVRTDLTFGQLGQKSQHRSHEKIAEEAGESVKQVQRFLRLNNLIPELQEYVDNKKIAFNPAVELSYLNEEEQQDFYETMRALETPPSLSQAQRLKKLSQEEKFDIEKVEEIMEEDKKSPLDRMTFDTNLFKAFFPESYTKRDMQEVIIKLLQEWTRKQKS